MKINKRKIISAAYILATALFISSVMAHWKGAFQIALSILALSLAFFELYLTVKSEKDRNLLKEWLKLIREFKFSALILFLIILIIAMEISGVHLHLIDRYFSIARPIMIWFIGEKALNTYQGIPFIMPLILLIPLLLSISLARLIFTFIRKACQEGES